MRNWGLLFLVAFLSNFLTRCLSSARSTKASLLLQWPLQPVQDVMLWIWQYGQEQQRLQADCIPGYLLWVPWAQRERVLVLESTRTEDKERQLTCGMLPEAHLANYPDPHWENQPWPEPGVRVTAVIPMSNFRWLTSSLQYFSNLQHWATIKVSLGTQSLQNEYFGQRFPFGKTGHVPKAKDTQEMVNAS